ncbi:hypothetical protein Trydic_g13081 [Trypoxylus dichotomus]
MPLPLDVNFEITSPLITCPRERSSKLLTSQCKNSFAFFDITLLRLETQKNKPTGSDTRFLLQFQAKQTLKLYLAWRATSAVNFYKNNLQSEKSTPRRHHLGIGGPRWFVSTVSLSTSQINKLRGNCQRKIRKLLSGWLALPGMYTSARKILAE